MKTSARTRWTLYAVAAVATVAAMWGVGRRTPDADDVVVARAPAPRSGTSPTKASTGAPALHAVAPDARRGLPPTADPFDTQRRAVASTATVPSAPIAPPRPTAPPVPFTYLGRWVENGKTYGVLDRQGAPSIVRVDQTMDRTYRVRSIGETTLVLEYLPLHVRQTVSAETGSAETTTAPASAAPAAANGPSSASDPNGSD